eukprot:1393240-Prorocentrum_lima.AAC.1
MSLALVSALHAFGSVEINLASKALAGVDTNPISSRMKGTTSLPYCRFFKVAPWRAARPGHFCAGHFQ